MSLSLQSVTLDTQTSDKEALLVFRDGRLLVVLTRLGDIHCELEGHWFIEAMFGDLPVRHPPTFNTLDDFRRWMREECNHPC